MTKCPGFFVYVRITVKSIGLYEAKEKSPPVRPVGIFDFLGVGHVPKCLIGLGIETTRNAPDMCRCVSDDAPRVTAMTSLSAPSQQSWRSDDHGIGNCRIEIDQRGGRDQWVTGGDKALIDSRAVPVVIDGAIFDGDSEDIVRLIAHIHPIQPALANGHSPIGAKRDRVIYIESGARPGAICQPDRTLFRGF